MFLGDNAHLFQSEQECVVCPYQLGNLVVLHGLNKDGVAIDFHHDHDVLVASKRLGGELAVWLETMVSHAMYVWVYMSCIFLPWR